MFLCRHCLLHFSEENALKELKKNYSIHEFARIKVSENTLLPFKNIRHSLKVPFVGYADFECRTESITSCSSSSARSFTEKDQKHDISGSVSLCAVQMGYPNLRLFIYSYEKG
ncbi:hypothetical protein AVEN_153204-1 [Araneus ventricosus]|uniref:Uncharacterized protein n=1 Tax=Araneus ventricosus TaxID=182803 RepID=A0A4Y2WL09_ARAVE|nr:hypothetical protein AVEN_153204-1 [Araneus ventricosus]